MLTNPALMGVGRLMMAALNSPPMSRGEEGEGVALLQRALVSLGHPMPRSTRSDGTMDGVFGGEMQKQVKNFQVRNGLVDRNGFGDGIIGKLTMAAFDALIDVLIDPFLPTPGGGKTPIPVGPKGLDPSVRMTVPESRRLLEAYESFKPYKGHICSRVVNGSEISNQCAIRMGVALHLADCGFNFAGWPHSPHGASANCCDFNAPHQTNATQLYVHLRNKGMHWEKYKIAKNGAEVPPNKKRSTFIHDRLRDRKGIIFMRRCFGKMGSEKSHIDYWDGTTYMNSRMNYWGNGEPKTGVKMIYSTRQFVAFLPVKDTG